MGAPPRPSPGRGPGRSTLNDQQLTAVMLAAKDLPDEKRRTFLERISARLSLRGARISDTDLDKTIQAALRGLAHNATARS